MVDHRDRRAMDSADRLFGAHLGFAADTDLPEVCGGHEDFDSQRIDLRKSEDWTLVVTILARNQQSLDDDAINRASKQALADDFFRMEDVETRELSIELRLFELLFGDLNLRIGLFDRRQRAHRLGVKLIQASMLAPQKPRTCLGGFHGMFVGRTGARERQ